MHKLFRIRHGESGEEKEIRLLSPIANALGQKLTSNETEREIAALGQALPLSHLMRTFVQ